MWAMAIAKAQEPYRRWPEMSEVNALFGETLIALADVPALLPWPMSLSVVKRWIAKGYKGVRLESARVGGRRLTSREAVARFLARVNAAPLPVPEPAAAAVAVAG